MNIADIRNKIASMKSDEMFIKYIEVFTGLRRSLVTLNSYLNTNTDDHIYQSWSSNYQSRYNNIIESHNKYRDSTSGKETRMDIIRERIPDLYSTMLDSSKKNLEVLCETYKAEDILTILSVTTTLKSKRFSLHNANISWDTSTVLGAYRSGDVNIEYICQCFYFNSAVNSIQTVNYNGSDREIQSIYGNEDIVPYLDLYHNAYMSYNAPKLVHPNQDILIIESMTGSTVDKLIKYIEENGIVPVQEIKNFYNSMNMGSGNLISTIRSLNERCLDITYLNKDSNNITSLNNGDILRCTIKGVGNSMITSYMIFYGELPNNIKTNRQLQKYIPI